MRTAPRSLSPTQKSSPPRTVAFDDLLKVGARTEVGDNTQGIADRVGCQRVQRRVWSNHSIPVGPGGDVISLFSEKGGEVKSCFMRSTYGKPKRSVRP